MRDRIWRALLWAWHETFGFHDPRVVAQAFRAGHRTMTMECECGWTAKVKDGEELPL